MEEIGRPEYCCGYCLDQPVTTRNDSFQIVASMRVVGVYLSFHISYLMYLNLSIPLRYYVQNQEHFICYLDLCLQGGSCRAPRYSEMIGLFAILRVIGLTSLFYPQMLLSSQLGHVSMFRLLGLVFSILNFQQTRSMTTRLFGLHED